MGEYKKYIDDLMGFIQKLSDENKGIAEGFMKMHQTTTTPGALDVKTKELIGLAIGVNARCKGCIALHMAGSLKAGATKEEIMEALGVSILMGGGPALVHAGFAYEALEEMTKNN